MATQLAIPFFSMSFLTFGVALIVWSKNRNLHRAEFIRTYEWPPGLYAKVVGKYPHIRRKDAALVSRGLRQFFVAYLMSGKKYVAMPSQVADELWHEFILYTRDYDAFCKKAFGGFLHHTPAVALRPEHKRDNEGLRRVWWYCCKYENINAKSPTRVPLLFALDSKLKIPNGYVYHPDCEQLRRNGAAGAQCGGDFTSSSFDGGTSGFGDSGNGDSSGHGGGLGGGDVGGGDSGGGDSGGGSCGGGGCGGGGD